MSLHRIVSTFGCQDRVCDELGEVNGLQLWRFFVRFWGSQLHFRRRVAFLFRVAAVYVIGGAMFGGISTLGSGAVFGGCTGEDGGTAGKCVGETMDGIVSTLGSDAGNSFAS